MSERILVASPQELLKYTIYIYVQDCPSEKKTSRHIHVALLELSVLTLHTWARKIQAVIYNLDGELKTSLGATCSQINTRMMTAIYQTMMDRNESLRNTAYMNFVRLRQCKKVVFKIAFPVLSRPSHTFLPT